MECVFPEGNFSQLLISRTKIVKVRVFEGNMFSPLIVNPTDLFVLLQVDQEAIPVQGDHLGDLQVRNSFISLFV